LENIYKRILLNLINKKMVNQTVLEYFRVNKGNYKIEDLKKKILSAGYSQQDITEALAQLAKQTQGAVPKYFIF